MINVNNSNCNNTPMLAKKKQALMLTNSVNVAQALNSNRQLNFTGLTTQKLLSPLSKVKDSLIGCIPPSILNKLSQGKSYVADRVLYGKFTRYIFEMGDKNRALLDAGLATALGWSLRPLAILVMPGQKKEDKQYSVAKSFATGAIGLMSACMVFSQVGNLTKALTANKKFLERFSDANIIPNLKKSLEAVENTKITEGFIKLNKDLVIETFGIKVKGKTEEQIKAAFKLITAEKILEKLNKNTTFAKTVLDGTVKNRADEFAKSLNMAVKYSIAIPESFFLYKLVTPIIDKLFPKKKGKAPTAGTQQNPLVSIYNQSKIKQGGKA